jgi:hypothetical protein
MSRAQLQFSRGPRGLSRYWIEECASQWHEQTALKNTRRSVRVALDESENRPNASGVDTLRRQGLHRAQKR